MGKSNSSPKKGEFTQTSTNENTTIANLGAGSRTVAENKPVGIIQITSGADQGRIFNLSELRRLSAGRSKDCDMVLTDPSCSRNHGEFFSSPDGTLYIKDLGSTNGTKVNGLRISEAVELKDGDRVQFGDNSMMRFSVVPEDEAKTQIDVYYRATRDALTNAYNRRQFEEAVGRELAFQSRGGKGLGLVMFDVDHFKKINDSFGHPTGDEVLREIGRRVFGLIRKEDIFSRVGGEEFALLTRNDGEEGLKIFSERLRRAMEETPAQFEGRQIPFAISVGYTHLKEKMLSTYEALVQTVDEALYEAKKTGRNRCVYKEHTPPKP